jgi:hypothetical protein
MIVLIIQKDTLENNKVKSVLKITDVAPETFLSNLQESHCFVCQLVAYTENKPSLFDKLIHLASGNKTNFGKDWYEFDHETLSKIITLFIESDRTIIDFTSISSIYGFNFQIFPVITKEVKITSNSLVTNKEVKEVKEVKKDIVKEKEDLLTLIDNLQETEIPRRKKESSKTKISKKE